nr:hypothetical protein BaRGS_024674 [Batillaria attramentaria]
MDQTKIFAGIHAVWNGYCLQDDLVSTGPGVLVTNLNLANFVMAAPATVVLTADLVFRRRYVLHEKKWKTSFGCKSAWAVARLQLCAWQLHDNRYQPENTGYDYRQASDHFSDN